MIFQRHAHTYYVFRLFVVAIFSTLWSTMESYICVPLKLTVVEDNLITHIFLK